jgi:hypothetical protein
MTFVMARHRCERWSHLGGVARGVDGRIRNALQKLVELEMPTLVPLDAGSIKIEEFEVGNAAGRVDHEIGFSLRLPAVLRPGANDKAVAFLLYRVDRMSRAHVNADLAKALHEPTNHIGIKMR